MYATTDELIAAVRRKGRIPDSVPDYTDAVILAEANDAISSFFVPVLSSLRQGFLVVPYDVTLTAGTQNYTVPPRAAGDALESVSLVMSDGREMPLSHVEISQITGSPHTGRPVAYAFEGTRLVLMPTPDGAETTVRVRYTQRRNKLVPTSSCALVASVVSQTVNSLDVVTAVTSSSDCDIVRPRPPFLTIVDNGGIFARSNPPGTIGYTFDNGVDLTGVIAGDYLSLNGQTCVVQLPVELHAPLADLTASSILRQMNFMAESAAARKEGADAIAGFKLLAAPRVKDQLVKVVNRGSVLRMRAGGRYGF